VNSPEPYSSGKPSDGIPCPLLTTSAAGSEFAEMRPIFWEIFSSAHREIPHWTINIGLGRTESDADIRRSQDSFWEDGMTFTKKQGQYLAFIYCYTKIHRQPPAERDMQMYFEVSAPSIHQMVLTLEKKGLISRSPGQARSIRLIVPKEEIPQLD
jgi:hypothetical protein